MSGAHRASINLDDIMKTAGWSSECCFAKHYNRRIDTASSFANVVLSVKLILMCMLASKSHGISQHGKEVELEN